MQLFWVTLRKNLIGISSDQSIPEREENVPYNGPNKHTDKNNPDDIFLVVPIKIILENIFFFLIEN